MRLSEVLPMGGLFAAAIALAWLSAQPPSPCAREVTEECHFQPAEAVSVSNITIPIRSVANGTVVLSVMISEDGKVRSLRVRRDIASETEEAVRSVRTWKFAPAKLNGKAVTSRMTIAVTFIPVAFSTPNITLPPLIDQGDEASIQPSFQPPDVVRATFPMYPGKGGMPGTAILEVSINEAGRAESPKVLLEDRPFATMAIQAIEDWRFTPATLNGTPVQSKVVLVFCFRQPLLQLTPG